MNKTYENVKLGKGVIIEDFTIIGVPPKGMKEDELETIIGDNSLIRSHSVIYAGTKIGKNFQTGHHVNIRENSIIGNNVSIGTETVIEHHVKIEDNVRIHTHAFVPEYTILKKGCWIGPNVVITNTFHPLCKNAKDCLQRHGFVTVKENAKIGANATILPGIIIGKNSLVGAGSVVTKDVPANAVVVGNPTKVIKDIDDIKCKFDDKLYPYRRDKDG